MQQMQKGFPSRHVPPAKKTIQMVKNNKAETKGHNLTIHLIAHFIEMMGHKAEIEADFGDYIADVFDWKTGLAYEVQTNRNKKAEKSKFDRALLHGEIKDVVFIHLKGATGHLGFPPRAIVKTLIYQNLRKKITGA